MRMLKFAAWILGCIALIVATDHFNLWREMAGAFMLFILTAWVIVGGALVLKPRRPRAAAPAEVPEMKELHQHIRLCALFGEVYEPYNAEQFSRLRAWEKRVGETARGVGA
jgi:hypothetical protein